MDESSSSDSLTLHLSDPKVVVIRPRPSRRSTCRFSRSSQNTAVSVFTLIVIVLAGGQVLRAWQPLSKSPTSSSSRKTVRD